jgi:plasmid stabilization system protein ParE
MSFGYDGGVRTALSAAAAAAAASGMPDLRLVADLSRSSILLKMILRGRPYCSARRVNAMNYYVVLGIPSTADATAIRSAFRGLVRQYHPDAGQGSSPQRFREIVEAYETLSDPERRRTYDARLRTVARPRIVEPLARNRPEPLFSARFAHSRHVDMWTHHEQTIDELFRALERLFWDF